MTTFFYTRSRPWHKSPKHVKRLELFHGYKQRSNFWPMSSTYVFIKKNQAWNKISKKDAILHEKAPNPSCYKTKKTWTLGQVSKAKRMMKGKKGLTCGWLSTKCWWWAMVMILRLMVALMMMRMKKPKNVAWIKTNAGWSSAERVNKKRESEGERVWGR